MRFITSGDSEGSLSTLTVVTSSLPNATVGVAYSASLAATGGALPSTWSLVSAIPDTGAWISVSTAGVVSGTPGTAETESVTVRVVDSQGASAQATVPLLVNAAGQTFNFYISPTGSDSNPGTLASPWAITAINTKQGTYAGKRVGLLPGSYDVSGLMLPNSGGNPQTALILNGSTNSSSPTYLGSSDSSGNYSPRTATIDAKGSSGYYGGSNSFAGFVLAGGCTYGTHPASNKHNWVIDGLRFTGFVSWAVTIGNYDASSGAIQNPVIKNCEFTGGNASNNTAVNGSNLCSIANFYSINGIITNNYIHDNIGWTDGSHFSAMYIWGSIGNSPGTSGLQVTYNTIVNSGNLHQKEHYIYNSEVAYNYIDMTGTTPSTTQGQNAACISGWGPDQSSLGTVTKIHHNILIGPGQYLWLTNDVSPAGWYTPCQVYNNTCISNANQASGGSAGFVWFEMSSGTHLLTYYNNLQYDNGFTIATDYGYALVNLDAFALGDYNLYGTQNHYTTIPSGQQSGGEVTYGSLAAFQSAVGAEAHSFTTATNPFTNAGTFADQYQVQSGSPAYQAGRVGGSGSTTTNIGAWDGSGRPGADWVT